jgi:hypothetical protein
MSQVGTHTTAVRIRFPNEVLAILDQWAAVNDLPRSVAVRRLMLRGWTCWTGDFDTEVAEEAAIISGEAIPWEACNCSGGPDTCTGNCR